MDADVLAVSIDLLASAVAANSPVTEGVVDLAVEVGVRLREQDPEFLKQSVMALLGDLFRKAAEKFDAAKL